MAGETWWLPFTPTPTSCVVTRIHFGPPGALEGWRDMVVAWYTNSNIMCSHEKFILGRQARWTAGETWWLSCTLIPTSCVIMRIHLGRQAPWTAGGTWCLPGTPIPTSCVVARIHFGPPGALDGWREVVVALHINFNIICSHENSVGGAKCAGPLAGHGSCLVHQLQDHV